MAQVRKACKSYCNKLKQLNRYRILPTTLEENNNNNQHRHFVDDDDGNDTFYSLEGNANAIPSSTILDFSSNDYLSLSNHPEVCRASIEFTQKYGCGSTGSRLLSGDSKPIRDLERRIARDKQAKGGALVFNTGYQANVSVLATLLDPNLYGGQPPLVFFDRLNHSSLHKATRLAGVKPIFYEHNNMAHLGQLLDEHMATPSADANAQNPRAQRFVVSESVFSMDGDVLPMDELLAILDRHPDIFLYLDEAHATGLIGPNGFGLSSRLNQSNVGAYVAMGTFGKALGGFGAYLACSHPEIHDFLVNRAPGFVFTTALPPSVIGAAGMAWHLAAKMDSEREALSKMSSALRSKLCNELGLKIAEISNNTEKFPNSSCVNSIATPIIPVILGDDRTVMEIKEQLLQCHGIRVAAIRPPTVPPGTARLRISLNRSHSNEHIDKLIYALRECLTNMKNCGISKL